MINKTFTMLVEEQNNGMFEGYTENYIKVFVKNNLLQPNQFVKVKLTQVIAGGMLAEVIGD
jgi:tRNA A37 methylthiotransferase MiaB